MTAEEHHIDDSGTGHEVRAIRAGCFTEDRSDLPSTPPATRQWLPTVEEEANIMKLLKSSLIMVFAALGLLVQTAVPAGAITIAGGVAVVNVRTAPGLCYPGLCTPTGGTFGVTSTSACASVAQNVNKPGKAVVEAGTCVIATTSGVFTAPQFVGPISITGPYCGRSSGTVVGTVTVNVIGGGQQVFAFSGAFNTAGSAVAITGTATKAGTGQTGPFAFAGDAIPVISVPAPIGPGGPSCSAGNQTDFTVAGIFDTVVL